MIAVIADIHGNLPALEAVLREIDKSQKIEKIVVLGDIIGYGPFVNEVIELIRDAIVLMGNHEYGLITGDIYGFHRLAKWSINYARKKISYRNYLFLKDLPVRFENEKCIFVHASPKDPLFEYIYERPKGINKVVVCGHTHVPKVKEGYLNPGSVGLPRFGPKNVAYYMIVEEEKCRGEIKRVIYDQYELFRKMYEEGFPAALIDLFGD